MNELLFKTMKQPVDKRAGQVGEAVVCRSAGQPRQQSRSLQTAARGRRIGFRVGIAVAG